MPRMYCLFYESLYFIQETTENSVDREIIERSELPQKVKDGLLESGEIAPSIYGFYLGLDTFFNVKKENNLLCVRLR